MPRPGWLAVLTQHGDKPPYFLKVRSADWFIIGTVALAVFTDMFLYGMIVPVLPFSLENRSNVGQNRVQYWVSVLIAVYGASLLAFSPICGWLADHTTSRRSPLLIGLLALLGSTVLLNVGSTIGIMVVARILQGASAAVVWVVGLALLADTVPQEHLAQAMGYVGLGMSLGILIAPLLGGVVYDHAGYDAVFGMCYALIGVDIILRLLLVEKKVAARWDPEAAGRERTVQIQASQNNPEGGAVVNEPRQDTLEVEQVSPSGSKPRRLRNRLPPVLSLLYSRRLLSALFGSIIQASIFTSFDSVLTLHAANVFNWSSTGAALLFLPVAIPSFFAPIFGWVSDKVGPRYPTALGFLFACPPLVCLRFVDQNTIQDKVLICALLALVGFTLTWTFPPIMAEISNIVEAKEKKMIENGEKGYGKGGAYAQAYALFNVAFAAGCMIGPLLAGFIVQETGWATMAWVFGLLSAITAVPSFFYMGGFLFKKT
ncbi:MFS transporter-like protein [Corynespora cassiicola Philippines]|uniref:MFS transporter-like protein n=1 Tax=Corynespora cassiicola Philippines TaxID=1448308 RepID=A0A2T2NMK0_CORCC|nr:MFS transporter-like protein [Corynespora cassiicola Philippines]